MHHANGFAQAAALRQLDVDAIDRSRELRNIGRNQTRFVSENGQPGAFAHESQAVDVVGRDRLLEHLHLIIGEEIAHPHRLLRRPGRICIYPQALLGRSVADYADDLHVAIGAELDF